MSPTLDVDLDTLFETLLLTDNLVLEFAALRVGARGGSPRSVFLCDNNVDEDCFESDAVDAVLVVGRGGASNDAVEVRADDGLDRGAEVADGSGIGFFFVGEVPGFRAPCLYPEIIF